MQRKSQAKRSFQACDLSEALPTQDQRPKGVNPAIAGMMHLIPRPLLPSFRRDRLLRRRGDLQIAEVKGERKSLSERSE